MRLHSYKAADHHRLRLVVNQYPNQRPIGLALHLRRRVLSLVWSGPASMSDKKRKAHPVDRPHRDGRRINRRG